MTSSDVTTAAPDAETQREMYRDAVRIKLFDERYLALMKSGAIGGMYYSPRGQEFCAVSVAANLRPDDYVVTIYRGLHDQIAKGVPLRELWAEYLGKSTGSCGGKGGPMHVTAPDYGLMVTTGVVGSGIPIANGLALSAHMLGQDRVTVVNFGDGATNIGAFHESLNLASIWRLPVVFVCQNNQYAEYTPLAKGTALSRISDRAASYSMPGVTVDGNDPVALYRVAGDAIERARSGGGPTLIEALTYRFNGHVIGDQQVYIPKDELARAIADDPVVKYRRQLIDAGLVAEADLDRIEADAAAEVADAAEFAMNSPWPAPESQATDVYAKETVG